MKSSNLLIVFLGLTVLISSCKVKPSENLNLDFETIDVKNKNPINWYFGNDPNYKASLDSTIVYHGKYSVKLENIIKPTSPLQGIGVVKYISNSIAVKSIRLTGFIKTENTTNASIGLYVGYTDLDGDTMKTLIDSTLIGSHDWKEFSVYTPISTDADNYFFGLGLFGEGKIWIDNLKLFVDDKQLSKTPPPLNFKANKNELEWLKKHCLPISTPIAKDGFEDLEPLKEIIGDAKIVALGENTHGSREVFQMKDRLVEFLSTEMNFTIFSLEASLPEAYLVNDYVLQGIGDPKTLLGGLHFWTCNTQEVLDMVIWMRKFNASKKGPIQFTGFDMQYPNLALNNLLKFAEKNDKYLKSKLDSIANLVAFLKTTGPKAAEYKEEINILKQECNIVLSLITKNKAIYMSTFTGFDYNRILQNAIILNQSTTLAYFPTGGNYYYRDESMAKNIELILENNPDAKIILWAHNGHINNQKQNMGRLLKDKFGDKYFSIGFLSNSGTYTAKKSNFLNSKNVLIEGKRGSFEYSFHKLDLPCFLFDFRQLDSSNPNCKWLSSSLNYRSIGALTTDDQFRKSNISKLFNAIIYIDSTHASECFDVTK